MLSLTVNHLSGLTSNTSLHQLGGGNVDGDNANGLQANKEKRAVIFKRAEAYVKEYRDAEREKIRLAREARAQGNFYVPDEPKLVFVVRIKG